MTDPRIMKVIEECAELQKALCKAERFGWDACPPKHPGRTNRAHVMEEMQDVTNAMADVWDTYIDVE